MGPMAEIIKILAFQCALTSLEGVKAMTAGILDRTESTVNSIICSRNTTARKLIQFG
jgi:hypothetical protein